MEPWILTFLGIALTVGLIWLLGKIIDGGSEIIDTGVLLVPWIVGLVVCCIAVPLQYHLDQANKFTYHQFFNGVVTGVEKSSGDSSYYTYDRQVKTCKWEDEEEDDDGTPTDVRKYVCTVQHYYDDIFASLDSWTIHTNIGDIDITNHALPEHWYPGRGFYEEDRSIVEEDIKDASYGANGNPGEPVQAVQAQQTLNEGDPLPVTLTGTSDTDYTNYILGSGDANFEVTSENLKITSLNNGPQAGYYSAGKKMVLLPNLPSSMDANWQTKKVEFIGWNPSDNSLYEQALMHLNMEAGSIHPASNRFDINIVMVNDALISDEEANAYTKTVNAFWESSFFQNGALPKNMAVVVLGTNGLTVTWARGFTLVQAGYNGRLWQDLQTFLPGTSVNPLTLIGWPKAVVHNMTEVSVTPSQGILEKYLILSPQHFVRPPLTNNQGNNGYNYLDDGPPFFDIVRFYLVTWLFALLFAFFFLRWAKKQYV